MRRCVETLLVVSLLLGGSRTAQAQGWPALTPTRVAGGFNLPLHVTHAGDGSGRLFVVEQGGRIRILNQGVLLSTPFLDISGRVSCCGERGLLSVAFPPGYATKGYFYVDYTDLVGNTVVSRFFVMGEPNLANPTSEQIVLQVTQPYANHNGGQLAFGSDGFLYVSVGDGGSGGDPENRAQNPLELLGKILRIDVESGVAPYGVPPSNPFVGNSAYRPEIWALGLRNPWRLSFDRLTGDLWIGDVGQGEWEEVDFQPVTSGGGENYGWRIMEGKHCYNAPTCNQTGLVLPVVEYHHTVGGCSVTGGMVHRNPAQGSLDGIYFFGDYCTGRVWGLRPSGAGWEMRLLLDSPFFISSFGEDESGRLYLADHSGGTVYGLLRRAAPADYDGDGTSDWQIYRNGVWLYFGPCAHLLSEQGAAVDPACSACAAKVCSVDPACCSNAWSGTCVDAVKQLCR
jgi:hypothetical protein